MKTAEIIKLKKDLLIVEMPEESYYEITGRLLALNNSDGSIKIFKGSFYLLGKPDEISEEDARELVKSLPSPILNCRVYRDYSKTHSFIHDGYLLRTAKESLLSLMESEIYWDVNPLGKEPIFTEALGVKFINEPKEWERIKAEQKTFDRNRSVIFKKN